MHTQGLNRLELLLIDVSRATRGERMKVMRYTHERNNFLRDEIAHQISCRGFISSKRVLQTVPWLSPNAGRIPCETLH